RAHRGGAFNADVLLCRPAMRAGDTANARTLDTGFRVVMVGDLKAKPSGFGAVSGIVTEDGRPKPDIKVELRELKGALVAETKSREDAAYGFERVKVGDYELRCQQYKAAISVRSDENTVMSFDLTPKKDGK